MMINVQNFNIDVAKNYKCFYLLKNIYDVENILIVHQTPAGPIEFKDVDAYKMLNGRIILAWRKLANIAPMHNFTAINGSISENVNLVPLERVIDIYDKPVNAQIGTFIFTNSDMVINPSSDWRCDNGKYGPAGFQTDIKVIDHLSEIKIYEPILSINGVGHIIYIEGVQKQNLTKDFLTNGKLPTVGRTLWETLKLIREWDFVNHEPFNNNEPTALKAHLFIKGLNFTDEELQAIDAQIPMQVANYLMGSPEARKRPNNVIGINDEIKNILFSRLASGSVSALEFMNPGMWDIQELLETEKMVLKAEMDYFKNMPQGRATDLAVSLQNRFYENKKAILDMVSNGTL